MSFPATECIEDVTIAAITGHSAYGAVYAAPSAAKAYLEPTSKRVTNAQGQEVVANYFVVFPSTVSVHVGDKVTWGTEVLEVVDCAALRFGGGRHHTEGYLKSVAV